MNDRFYLMLRLPRRNAVRRLSAPIRLPQSARYSTTAGVCPRPAGDPVGEVELISPPPPAWVDPGPARDRRAGPDAPRRPARSTNGPDTKEQACLARDGRGRRTSRSVSGASILRRKSGPSHAPARGSGAQDAPASSWAERPACHATRIRLITSCRVGISGSSRRASSSPAISSRGRRTVTASVSTGGRPIFFMAHFLTLRLYVII